jgi:hypothetical protein
MSTLKKAEQSKTHRTAAVQNTPSGDMPAQVRKFFSGKYREWWICAAIFLSALFVIITISNPALFMNDEWITVNQVHQLDLGHQITVNEGKYGVYKNGTPGGYFAVRNNILMYSAALPVVSLPAMKLIDLFGDNFRLIVIFFWAFIPLFVALIVSWCYPLRARIGPIRITVLAAVAGFLLIALNLLVYSSFVYSAPDAPVEVAAVVFTNHFFFALTVVMTYLIARRIFEDQWMAIFAALFGAACSAYLFWGANAKDHMATVAVFAVVLYFFVCYLRSLRIRDGACGFFSIGILAWFRPEVGFSAFFCIGLFFLAYTMLRVLQKKESFKTGIMHLCTIFFTAAGSVPFFINNLLITGNPLVPIFLRETNIRNAGMNTRGISISAITNANPAGLSSPLTVTGDLFSTLRHYIFSVSPNPLADLYGILFFPKSGSMGLFFVLPIAMLALLILPLAVFRRNGPGVASRYNRAILLLLIVSAASVFLAYIHDLNGLNASGGIGPDIRYLSPVYLPVALLSVVLLDTTILLRHPRVLLVRTCLAAIVFIPVLLIAMIIIDPFGSHLAGYTLFFNTLLLIEVSCSAGIVYVYQRVGRPADGFSDLLLPILLLTILSWQVMMVFLYSVAKFNGYPFWIPGIDALYHQFIHVNYPAGM